MATANTVSQPQKMGRIQAGWSLTKSAWQTFKLDKELAWLQLFGSISALIAAGILVAIGAVVYAAVFSENTTLESQDSWLQTALVIAGYLVVSFVTLFIINLFSGAIVYGAVQRFKGGNPTVSGSLSSAWRRWQPLALFSLMMATIGVILQLLEERLPFLGVIAARLAGAAWEIANFFAVPIIVLSEQRVAPLSATKQSVGIIKKVWGEGIVMQIGIGLIGFFVTVGYLLIVGAIVALTAATGLTVATISVAGISAVGFFVLILLFATLSSIIKAALYYYATTGESPAIFEKRLLEQAIRQKKKR